MAVIGVLALQGAVEEHLKQIINTGSEAVIVKHPKQLEKLDGLIIPGGESTAIGRLMARYGFIDAIKDFSNQKNQYSVPVPAWSSLPMSLKGLSLLI